MAYFKQLFSQAWSETWGVVFNSPFLSVLATLSIFGVSLIIHWQRKGMAEVKDALVIGLEGAVASIIVFGLVFVLHVLVLTPKRLYETANAALSGTAPKEEPRIKLDVADPEGRQALERTRTELEAANQELKQLRQQLTDRTISADTKQKLLDALRTAPKGTVFVKADWTDGEAIAFAKQIEDVLREAGFPILKAYMEVISLQDKGAFLCVVDPLAPPPHATPLLNAFKAAELSIQGATAPPNMKKLRDGDLPQPRELASDELVIWVTRKP